MLPEELQLQLFLYYPSYAIYFTLEKKFIAEKLLEDLPSLTTEKLYFLHQIKCERREEKYCTKDCEVEIKELIKYSIKENNFNILHKILEKHTSKIYKKEVGIHCNLNLIKKYVEPENHWNHIFLQC